MAEMAYASGTGNCAKCGEQLLQLEGNEDTPGGRQCIKCQSKRMISSGPINDTPDIGEEAINRVLMAAGIAVPGSSSPRAAQSVPKAISPIPVPVQNIKVNITPGQPFEEVVGEALKIMENLPMPKDIRQFKAISKIVSAMRALIQEQ